MSYDPHYANVSLLLHGDGADNGTVFTDNSQSPKTVTGYGNAKTSTAQSKFGGSSIAFDGSGDYLTAPGAYGEFSFGTGDFTIEFWARWSSITSEDGICFGYGIGWTLFIYPAGKLQWGRISPQSPVNLLASASSVTTDKWYHIAVTRESGTVKFWIDGNASGSVSDTANYSATGTLNIGKSHAGAWFQGWIDDFRITKGVARYTGNFTPQTIELIASASTPLGAASAYAQSVIVSQSQANTPSYDPHYANVSLLLHGDGADNGTVFTDNSQSPKTVTGYGNAKTSTAQSKFGLASIAFDGIGDYLTAPGSSGEFSFGTGDFTIEFWARWSSVASETAICFGYGIGWTLFIYPYGKLQWGRISPKSPVNLLESSSAVTTGQWYHIAVTRNSGSVNLWINGNASGSISDTENYSENGTLNIGKSHAGAWFQGWIDDFRVTKGVARYIGNFTPPDDAFPNPAPTIEVISSANTPLGAASAYAQSVIVSHAQANTPLGPVLAFAFTGNIAFAAADSPLGTVSALSVVVSACRIAAGGPLGVPATLASYSIYSIAARVAVASPLGIPQPLAWHDFTGQIGDTVTRYLMDLITPTGTVRVPISSWQATLRTGASSYVQCVIPAAQQWGAAINAATSFRIYRRAVTASGQAIEYMMAEAPADTPQFDRGPTNHTCTLSGYAPGFAEQDVSHGTDRTLTGIRSISSGASYRVRCAIDWLLRPGQRGVVDGVPVVVVWINYYVNTTDAYMEVGT